MAFPYVEATAGVLLASWIAYGLTGGADFGGGVWDLLARGPRARRQREKIQEAIGAIWEANHVWLVFVVVLLFTCFPLAFSTAMTALHIPIVLVLVGIAARGSAFAFRKHDRQDDQRFARWSLVFGASSAATPLFLGMTLAATATGAIRIDAQRQVTTGFVAGWTEPFAVAVGLFAVGLFAYLAAVYLTVDCQDDRELQADFRRRALVTGVMLAPAAFLLLAWSRRAAPILFDGLTRPSGLAIVAAASAAGAAALGLLWVRRFHAARAAAVAQTVFVLGGWGWAMRPHLIAPDVTLAAAASSDLVLRLFLVGTVAGAVILVPSMWYLYRVFKDVKPVGDEPTTDGADKR